MADTNRFKSREDAQQYLDNSGQTGTIRDTGIVDQFGRRFRIDNLKQAATEAGEWEEVNPKIPQEPGGTYRMDFGTGKSYVKKGTVKSSVKTKKAEPIYGGAARAASDPSKNTYVDPKDAQDIADRLNMQYGTDKYRIMQDGILWRVVEPSQIGTLKPVKKVMSEFDNEKDARDFIDREIKSGRVREGDYLLKSHFGKWTVQESVRKKPIYEGKRAAAKKVKELEELGVRAKVKPTLEGEYELEEWQPNEFKTQKQAEDYVSKMEKKNVRLKAISTPEGTWQAVKMGPTEFAGYRDAMEQQAKLKQSGIRTKVESTAETTTGGVPVFNVKRLGENEFLNRQEAVVKQRNLESRGITSEVIGNADGTYTVSGLKDVRKPVTSGVVERGIETARQTRVWAAPKIAAKRAKIEKEKAESITKAKEMQASAEPGKQKIGKQMEKEAIATAKIKQIGVTGIEKGGQVAAGYIGGMVATEQTVIPKAVKLAKAAIQEYTPAKRLGETPERMAEQNIPSAPAGEKTVFGTHGERKYKIDQSSGVPKIAARSLRKGSVVGEGTPQIAVTNEEEKPGDKLMDMSMGKKMSGMPTSGNVDFTKI